MSDSFTGATYRHIYGTFQPGEIVRGHPWIQDGHHVERSASRIIAPATRAEMKPIISGIIAACDRIKKERPRFCRGGTWYKVLED